MKFTSARTKANASARKYADRRVNAQRVRARWEADGNRCEGCHERVETVEVAHLFGRRHIIAEPYASDLALMAPLCQPCHRSIDSNQDVDLRDNLRFAAALRFASAHGIPDDVIALSAMDGDPVALIRTCERYLEETPT